MAGQCVQAVTPGRRDSHRIVSQFGTVGRKDGEERARSRNSAEVEATFRWPIKGNLSPAKY